MADVNNKLGLTDDERIVYYSTGTKNNVAEIRRYDPTSGYLTFHDPIYVYYSHLTLPTICSV